MQLQFQLEKPIKIFYSEKKIKCITCPVNNAKENIMSTFFLLPLIKRGEEILYFNIITFLLI